MFTEKNMRVSFFVEKKLHDTIHLYGYQDISDPDV